MPLFHDVIRWRFGLDMEDGPDWRKPRQGKLARRAFRKAITGTGPFNFKLRGEEAWRATGIDIATLMARITALSPKVRIGQAFMVEAADGKTWVLVKSKENMRVPIKETEGNDDIDKILTFALVFAGAKGHVGICARRFIRGVTTVLSQHCPWLHPKGSNAVDLIWKSLKEQERGVEIMVAAAKRGEIPLGRIISWRNGKPQVWDPQQGWHDYTGVDPHNTHAHAEGKPESSGPIAASC